MTNILHTLVSTSSPNILEGLYFCSNLVRSWQYKKKRRWWIPVLKLNIYYFFVEQTSTERYLSIVMFY